jgi:3D (Asp-Asp-Asp) domain-containing protein
VNVSPATRGQPDMNKHLLATGVILSLITSNFILFHQYQIDMEKYEKKISSQSKIIKQKKVEIRKQAGQLTSKENEVKKLHTDLDKANLQIVNLKKQLADKEEGKEQRKLNMTLTFYGADCKGCSGITKTGIDVTNTTYFNGMKIIASDPRVIPLYSIVKIETNHGSFIAYVADTGSAIKGNILDVLVSSEEESYKYGRQQAVVTVIREGKGNS